MLNFVLISLLCFPVFNSSMFSPFPFLRFSVVTYAKDAAHVHTTLDFQALLLVVGAARATLILARHLILVRPNNGFLQCFLHLRLCQFLFSMS